MGGNAMAIKTTPFNEVDINSDYFKKLEPVIHSNILGSSALHLMDPDAGCPLCKRNPRIFYFKGCPHCGYTFLHRDILRQTS
jgi:hypothetical protein